MAEQYTRRDIFALSFLAAGGVLVGGCTPDLSTITPVPESHSTDSPEVQQPIQSIAREQWTEPVKQRILAFSLEDFQNKERRDEFISELADTYVKLSGSERLTSEQMTSPDHLILAPTHDDFVADYEARNPEQELPSYAITTAFTDTPNRRVTLNMEILQTMIEQRGDHPGIALASTLFHEWGHAETTDRTEGELLENPDNAYAGTFNGQQILWKTYRGASVRSGNLHMLGRFNEVVTESITTMRMRDQLGLEPIPSSYNEGGTDLFLPLIDKLGISLNELYELYSTSDLEGLATLIGKALPGEQSDLMKGLDYAFMIEDFNPSNY